MTYEFEYHFILFSVIFLIIGYLLRGDSQKNNPVSAEDAPESFFKKQNKIKSNKDKSQKSSTIDIDESTHVVKIKTDGLEKKYDEIGNSQTTKEDISGSINKLKNLKK